MRDKERHGTGAIGERHGFAKLTDETVLLARRLAASGVTINEISERLSIRAEHVSRIVRGRRWGHLPNALQVDGRSKAIPANKVRVCECGRKVRGPAFFLHRRYCSTAQSAGKGTYA
jgi:hypothetical protein